MGSEHEGDVVPGDALSELGQKLTKMLADMDRVSMRDKRQELADFFDAARPTPIEIPILELDLPEPGPTAAQQAELIGAVLDLVKEQRLADAAATKRHKSEMTAIIVLGVLSLFLAIGGIVATALSAG